MKLNFQFAMIAVFIVAAVFGVLVFSGAIPIGGNKAGTASGTVVLWGTVKATDMGSMLEEFNAANPTFSVKYVQKAPDSFDHDLLEALATGTGPDIFFLPDNLAFHYANKIFTIPYSSYPLASFKNNFAGAGEVFLTSTGLLAFPLSIDPLVMYYNRSILNANGIVYPPDNWADLAALVPTLTKKDDTNKITKSTIALGQFSNVAHAKDILTTLFMQSGNYLIAAKDGVLNSTLSNDSNTQNLEPVLSFYTSFADPLENTYSWNRSFPNSRDFFSSENLAFYLGLASELPTLTARNPNQDFLIAPVPQIKNANFKLTYGQTTGIAISAFSKNFNTAFTAASLLATGNFAKEFAATEGIAPARRDLLKTPPTDAYSPSFYASALYAKSWLDPSDKDTDDIFRAMIESVLANTASPRDAIKNAGAKIDFLLLRQ